MEAANLKASLNGHRVDQACASNPHADQEVTF